MPERCLVNFISNKFQILKIHGFLKKTKVMLGILHQMYSRKHYPLCSLAKLDELLFYRLLRSVIIILIR